jgi:hypothetical protein
MPKRDPAPSVKDTRSMRPYATRGNSKEKSARIAYASANTSRRIVSTRGGTSPAYEEWTVPGCTDQELFALFD